MIRTLRWATLLVVAHAVAAQAKPHPAPKFYFGFTGGVGILTADVSGDVVDTRANGVIEIGVGYEVSKNWLMEFTYGFVGRYREDRLYLPLDPDSLPPPDARRAYQVQVNPLFLRAFWTHSGIREEYAKPQLSIGVGFEQVSRLLRNYPGIPPEDTSQLLPAIEIGLASLFVFSRNFSGFLGARYTITERSDIVDKTRHLDTVGLVFGIRAFLPSPRDAAEP